MKILISSIFLILISFAVKSQTFLYSYIDPCTGLQKSLTVPSNGVTVTYFGQIQTFSPNDFQNGVFDQWATGVLNTYGNANPCGSIIGVSTAVDIAQGSAVNFISIINNISALSELQSAMGGGSLNTMSVIESAKSASKKKDKKNNSSQTSENSNQVIVTNNTTTGSNEQNNQNSSSQNPGQNPGTGQGNSGGNSNSGNSGSNASVTSGNNSNQNNENNTSQSTEGGTGEGNGNENNQSTNVSIENNSQTNQSGSTTEPGNSSGQNTQNQQTQENQQQSTTSQSSTNTSGENSVNQNSAESGQISSGNGTESGPINTQGQTNQTLTQSTQQNESSEQQSEQNTNSTTNSTTSNYSENQSVSNSTSSQNSEQNTTQSQNGESFDLNNNSNQNSTENGQSVGNSSQNTNNNSSTSENSINVQPNNNNSIQTPSNNNTSTTSGGNGSSVTTPDGTDGAAQTTEEKKINSLGGVVNSTQRATEGNKPQIVLSSDFAGFNFRDKEVSFGGKGTAGYTSMRWDGRRSYGVLLDYTSIIKGPNVTAFWANMAKRRIDLVSATGTISFYGRGSQYGTLAVGQMWSFPKVKNLKAIYLATGSFGNVYGEKFLGTAMIAGGMYDWKVSKRIDVKMMNLFIYAPYVSYYNDILLKSPYVIMPIIGTNIGITKKFKFNVNFGGAYAIKQNVMNFTLMFGTRLAI